MKSKQTHFSFVQLWSSQVWPKSGLSCKLIGWLIVSILATANVFAQGPSGRYYVTDESGFNKVWQFQGTTVTSFPTVPAGGADGPILVDGNTNTVRSVKGGFNGSSGPVPGSEYDFAGVVQGPLSLNFSGFSGYGRVIDAAFDGANAYIIAGLFGNAGIFRFNANFSGPGVLVFNLPAGAAATSQGITYDTTTNTFWTSDYDFSAGATGGRVRQWSLNGIELFSFPVVDNLGNKSERNTALAYDFTDDTFWMNAHVENTLGLGFGELWQFDRQGNFLQKIHARQFDPTAPQNILYWGGEIRATGEAHSPGRMTGGGTIGTSDVRHGFELHCDADQEPNNLQVNWGKNNKFHLESLTSAVCSDDPKIAENPPAAGFDTFVGKGTGRYNGVSGYKIEFRFTDAGEPGTNDTAKITIFKPDNSVLLTVSGNLKNGNHQAHKGK